MHWHSFLRPHSLPFFPKPKPFHASSSSSSFSFLPLLPSHSKSLQLHSSSPNQTNLTPKRSPSSSNLVPPRFQFLHHHHHLPGFASAFRNSPRSKYHLGLPFASPPLKFMLFFALLTLQHTSPALASDFSAAFDPLSIFGDISDISTGFASAFLLIFFSELGDKTFFIAALLAARNSAAVVFVGTFGALAAMTLISVVLGRTFHYVDEILPFRLGETDLPIDDIAAVCLLVYFGVSTLLDASSSDGQKSDNEQKEAELAVSDFSGNGAGILAAASTVVSTFLLVFVAEWGDKSFFSTIALAAASSPLGVIAGALAGHGVATLLAVLGGSLLGQFLSEKVIAYVGGVLFLVFAAVTLFEIVQ